VAYGVQAGIEPTERVTDEHMRPVHFGVGKQLVELVHDLLGRDDGGLRRTNVAVADAGPVVGAGACFPGRTGSIRFQMTWPSSRPASSTTVGLPVPLHWM
jgi:hypothetical protein